MGSLNDLKLRVDFLFSARVTIGMVFQSCSQQLDELIPGTFEMEKYCYTPSFRNCFLISTISADGVRPKSA